MATGSTSIYNIPYPLSTDPVNVHSDMQQMATTLETIFGVFNVSLSFPNTWTNWNVFETVSTQPTVTITQAGTGHALLVQDGPSDTTPFIIDSSGNLVIGKTTAAGAKLDVVGNSIFTGSVTAGSFIGTTYLGTTELSLSRSSANQGLTGISSIQFPGSTSGTITLSSSAIAGTTAITLPATSGTLLINPMTTAGDIIYGGASGVPTRLPAGSNSHVLTYDSATNAPKWSAVAAGYSAPTIGSTSIGSGATVTTIAGLTLTTPVITLNTTSNNATGTISWDSTNRLIQVGDGSGVTNIAPFIVNQVAKTGNYTLILSDANTLIQMNGAFTFTVPLNATVAYPIGTTISLIALTTGVQVAFTAGITSYATPGLKLRAAGSMATLIKLGTNTWALTGDLIA
jgi:hypothetical protein